MSLKDIFKTKTINRIHDYQEVFTSEAGQRVLDDLMKECHFLKPTYSPKDTASIHLNEGKREVILRILTLLNQDPHHVRKRIEKIQEEEERYDEAMD